MSARGTSTQAVPAVLEWPLTRRLFSPFAVLVYVYVAYFALTYSRIYEYVYWELMTLGTRIIGFHPTTHTLLLYAFGLVVLACGFVAGDILATSLHRRARRDARRADGAREVTVGLYRSVASFGQRLGGLPVVRHLGPGFTLALLGWVVAFMANGQQVIAAGGVSLLNISTRWAQSPTLVLVAATQIFFVPALIVSAKGPWRRVLVVLLFGASVVGLGLLGARNLPAKLVVSSFLAVVYAVEPRTIRRLAVVFLVLGVLAMGIVGSISKSGIYGPSATAGLAVALTYSDSVGTSYNLDRIVNLTPATGVYGGKLLRDSFLAGIPGVDAEYANFQLGRYLGGRSYFTIGGEFIDRSVSLAPTLLGAPYADWGVPGVIAQMLLLGGLFGYLQRRSRSVWWYVPFLVTMASYVINGVNAGVHNPHALIFVGVALLLTFADALAGAVRHGLSARPSEG